MRKLSQECKIYVNNTQSADFSHVRQKSKIFKVIVIKIHVILKKIQGFYWFIDYSDPIPSAQFAPLRNLAKWPVFEVTKTNLILFKVSSGQIQGNQYPNMATWSMLRIIKQTNLGNHRIAVELEIRINILES